MSTGLTGRMEPSLEEDQLAHEIIGAAIEVHRELGPGYHESIYEEALCIELELRNIPYSRQHAFAVNYKGRQIGQGRLDILVGGSVVVELKAVDELNSVHLAQVMSYLKATRRRLGLLINFNVELLKKGIKRVIWS